jgi:hypothetical protein
LNWLISSELFYEGKTHFFLDLANHYSIPKTANQISDLGNPDISLASIYSQ